MQDPLSNNTGRTQRSGSIDEQNSHPELSTKADYKISCIKPRTQIMPHPSSTQTHHRSGYIHRLRMRSTSGSSSPPRRPPTSPVKARKKMVAWCSDNLAEVCRGVGGQARSPDQPWEAFMIEQFSKEHLHCLSNFCRRISARLSLH